jgi:adducin
MFNCIISQGFRTGHIYHEPNLKKERRMERANSEVEIPPTTSSFAYYEDGKMVLKSAFDKHKKQQKTDWLNTPNAYKKEEIEEIGTATPKKITKVTDRD